MGDTQNQVQEPIENLDAEAIQAEEAVLRGEDETQVRSQVIEKYELDEDSNSELIDRLVSDKLEEQKKLSTAIKQKRSWRDRASKAAKTEETTQVTPAPANPAKIDEASVAKLVDERFAQRELDSLELSDEMKAEINKTRS